MSIRLKPSYMEWTPNELANVLRNWIGNRDQLLAAANMLQDQAQEIKQLKQDAKDCTCQGGHSEAYLKAKGKL
jgi:hypothetical protein